MKRSSSLVSEMRKSPETIFLRTESAFTRSSCSLGNSCYDENSAACSVVRSFCQTPNRCSFLKGGCGVVRFARLSAQQRTPGCVLQHSYTIPSRYTVTTAPPDSQASPPDQYHCPSSYFTTREVTVFRSTSQPSLAAMKVTFVLLHCPQARSFVFTSCTVTARRP